MGNTTYPDLARVDATDKVRGATRYAADDARPGLLHAVLAVATVGRGSITALDATAARAARGVRLVLTHEDLADVKSAGFLLGGGYAFQSFQPMLSPAIAYLGQPIALVVAAGSLLPLGFAVALVGLLRGARTNRRAARRAR